MNGRVLDPNESPTFGKSLSLCVDNGIGAMSLSPNGRDAVLAGRIGLYIIDMDDPFTPPRWLQHLTSWEVADVQWSPHAFQKPSWCISTSNQKALLWDLSRPSHNAIANILHSHTRAISDINFHPSDPEVLATCAIDTMVFTWDMRTPRKPVTKFADWRAGAIQVKFNHKNAYEVASTHDNVLYVWDMRSGAQPLVKVVDAHQGKINGLDFSQGLKNVITCSNDSTIKFWDLESNKPVPHASDFDFQQSIDIAESESKVEPGVVIKTDYPISRARTLPFGSDRACGVMPLLGGDDSIHIINYEDAYQKYLDTGSTQTISGEPAYSFKGHNGPIKDFLWRTKRESYEGFGSKNAWKEYQLVTWSSKDVNLRLWPHEDEIYKSVNYNPTFFSFKNESDSEVSEVKSPQDPKAYHYRTYCCEPEETIEDLANRKGGDVLSALTLFQISLKRRQPRFVNQVDQLNWISGVRIGNGPDRKSSSASVENVGPSNLGEEVSMVGHKFPFIRFEKISVSTGELVISLRGLIPVQARTSPNVRSSENLNDLLSPTDEDNTKEKSVISESVADGKSHYTEANASKSIDENLEDREQQLIFIRVAINFPRAYPYLQENNNMTEDHSKRSRSRSRSQPQSHRQSRENSIQFSIEETHELDKETKLIMEQHLREIAHFFANRHHRFCLEQCLRYLMGEKIDLNDSLIVENRHESVDEADFGIEVGNEGWVDDLIHQQPDFDVNGYSSGEEADADLEDLMPSADAKDDIFFANSLSPGARDDNLQEIRAVQQHGFDSTPLPKGCGAVWSPNGHLVCFFMQKTTRTTRAEASLKSDDTSVKAYDPHLAGDTRERRVEVLDDGDSSDSDDFNSNASESTSSEEDFHEDYAKLLKTDAASRGRVTALFKSSFGLGGRFIDRDSSHKSSLHRFASNSAVSNNRSSVKDDKKKDFKTDATGPNVVKIYDFSQFLPERVDLAKEYRVTGDTSANLAAFNAKVAAKYGLKGISDTWRVLEVILSGNVTLLPLLGSQKNSSTKHESLSIWGAHPFGYTWLIPEIFEFYWKRENTQMLAVMSCVVQGAEEATSHPSHIRDLAQFHFPLPDAANFPTTRGQERQVGSRGSYSIPYNGGSKTVQDDNQLLLMLSSSFNLLKELPATATSYPQSQVSSLDNGAETNESPERYSHYKKSRPGALTSMSLHNGSNSSLTEAKYDPRYDSKYDQKYDPKYDPKTPTTSRTLNSFFQPSQKRHHQNAIRAKVLQPSPVVTVEMNGDFDMDIDQELQSVPAFLDDDKISLIRLRYADTLYDWNLPIHRLEILNFSSTSKSEQLKTSSFSMHKCPIGLRKKNRQLPSQIFINTVSMVISNSQNAWNTDKRQAIKYCVYCQLAITKSFTLCSSCEHGLHSSCAKEWWSGEVLECPSGCGCTCVDHSFYR
ncbi:uncharacterized protein LODBEIA_P09380 [Lodderomyces beijingensis]|uniref:WDR59/RTC1-like RING zinc finger domain-containing protein n=1 Tax=Lodderomyces beijingensis TaxID=1775926 RepID=A0ABP0ZEY1_9ASCO